MDAPAFDEDEAFDLALGVEPNTEDVEDRLWQWICDIEGHRVTDLPEDVRRAAQRIGFAFDPSATVLAEATRLEESLAALKGDR